MEHESYIHMSLHPHCFTYCNMLGTCGIAVVVIIIMLLLLAFAAFAATTASSSCCSTASSPSPRRRLQAGGNYHRHCLGTYTTKQSIILSYKAPTL
jgi:hypothetical protein